MAGLQDPRRLPLASTAHRRAGSEDVHAESPRKYVYKFRGRFIRGTSLQRQNPVAHRTPELIGLTPHEGAAKEGILPPSCE
eukprot:6408220-Amphidinium_carterae.1